MWQNIFASMCKNDKWLVVYHIIKWNTQHRIVCCLSFYFSAFSNCLQSTNRIRLFHSTMVTAVFEHLQSIQPCQEFKCTLIHNTFLTSIRLFYSREIMCCPLSLSARVHHLNLHVYQRSVSLLCLSCCSCLSSVSWGAGGLWPYFCLDGGGPLCTADTVRAPEEGHLSASEPGAGREQEPAELKKKILNCSLFWGALLCSKLIILFCLFIGIGVKHKSKSLIQAEPVVFPFSGFELQKEYTKTWVRRPAFLLPSTFPISVSPSHS